MLILTVLLCSAFYVTAAAANGGLLWGSADERQAMVAPLQPRDETDIGAPSLFVGQSGSSFFRPYPKREKTSALPGSGARPASILRDTSPAAQIRDLIGTAEAGRAGYDAVQHGARIKPTKRPTAMTVGEIYDWIAATPGQPHAIGRYQFIPATLKRLVRQAGATRSQPFTPAFQNQLADILLAEAGMHEFHAGNIGRYTFMNNLAKIWAGFPTTSGRSHYHGYAGNKATMTWANFNAEMQQIYPNSRG